jgi:hypothetical protein
MDGLFKIKRKQAFRKGRRDAVDGKPAKTGGPYAAYYMAGYRFEKPVESTFNPLQWIRRKWGLTV